MTDIISFEISGKSAVVTGSTSGIGLAISKTFATQGANVMLNGLGNAQLIDEVCSSVNSLGSGKTAYHPANMTDRSQIADLITTAVREFGSVDILVNCAGIQRVSPLEDFCDDDWDEIIAINLSSAFHSMKHAVVSMLDSGWGRIINIASVHALVASPFKSAYVAAKHGIAGLTKTAALEYAEKRITVNAIAPGYVHTALVEGQIADTARARKISNEEVVRDVILAAQPSKQFVTADQIAHMCLYLVSDAASAINGAILSIDGGWSAH